MILYLHGFRGSPASHKARQLHARMEARALGKYFACPKLPVSPRAAATLCESIMDAADTPVTLIGSSLGAYYATYLAGGDHGFTRWSDYLDDIIQFAGL